jgi:hypothetical protein
MTRSGGFWALVTVAVWAVVSMGIFFVALGPHP